MRRAACSSLGEPTYGVFGALFREAYQVDPADSLEVARRSWPPACGRSGARDEEAEAIAPVLSYVLGVEEAQPRDIEPEQLQRQIALAARTLIERRLQQEPLLIVVEDLHWADAASVDLLRHVVDQLADRPLMLLLSHRPDARPPLVARAAQSIIRLAPLSPSETRALVAGLFGASVGDALAQLQDFVATRAGGNPLFVEEIVRSLVGKGVLVRQGDRWACTAACEAVDVPPTLHGLLLSRVDRLPADGGACSRRRPCSGRRSTRRCCAPSRPSPASRRGRARTARRGRSDPAGRARARGQAGYRFTHALVHEVVYQNLLLSRRTELHERVGGRSSAPPGRSPSG